LRRSACRRCVKNMRCALPRTIRSRTSPSSAQRMRCVGRVPCGGRRPASGEPTREQRTGRPAAAKRSDRLGDVEHKGRRQHPEQREAGVAS
jgi:hypothetical protein